MFSQVDCFADVEVVVLGEEESAEEANPMQKVRLAESHGDLPYIIAAGTNLDPNRNAPCEELIGADVKGKI